MYRSRDSFIVGATPHTAPFMHSGTYGFGTIPRGRSFPWGWRYPWIGYYGPYYPFRHWPYSYRRRFRRPLYTFSF